MGDTSGRYLFLLPVGRHTEWDGSHCNSGSGAGSTRSLLGLGKVAVEPKSRNKQWKEGSDARL